MQILSHCEHVPQLAHASHSASHLVFGWRRVTALQYKHITEERDMAPPDVEWLRSLANVAHGGADVQSDWFSALTVHTLLSHLWYSGQQELLGMEQRCFIRCSAKCSALRARRKRQLAVMRSHVQSCLLRDGHTAFSPLTWTPTGGRRCARPRLCTRGGGWSWQGCREVQAPHHSGKYWWPIHLT